MTMGGPTVRFRKGNVSWDVPATVSTLDQLIEAAPTLGVAVERGSAPKSMEEKMDNPVIKALSDMEERIQQILKNYPGILSRESAIAQVASSPLGTLDWDIWLHKQPGHETELGLSQV